MKHLFQNALVIAMGVALVGCEWGGSGDEGSWNDSSSIANFSGSYRGSGGYLVSDYSTTASSTPITSSGGVTYNTYTGEDGGNTGANRVSLSGKTSHGSVKPGSFTIIFGGVSGSAFDDGSGAMKGSYVLGPTNFPVTGGHFEYDTGVWTLQFAAPGLPVSQSISINYSAAGAATSSGSSSSSGSGASGGVSIYAFNVQQSGNKISIVDNNGSVYSGSMGDVRTTGGLSSSSTGGTPANGDQVIAPYSASGKSKSGMYVNLVGNFQGTVASVSSVSSVSGDSTTIKTSFALSDRVILGTWVEDGGKTGDIKGIAGSSSTITVSSSTSTNSP
ncbi:MAG: hypothetical protein WCI03_08890 [bacterium]